ncbi:MAG: bifunctional diguanylate cyclase/phosphodiesterase [Firmicutes bacterium]|nr:bifunctional diguanylate cyclase/phosphodiesterase [Bacillota bacterium]
MTYFKNYPIDTLKIDRSLSRDLTNDKHSREIVASIIAMCFSVQIKTIVEFVETEEQQRILDELGSVHCQGYLFNPVLTPDKAFEYIKNMNQIMD